MFSSSRIFRIFGVVLLVIVAATLVILGLAQGVNDPRETQRLRDEWTAWAQAAGFKSFIGLNDW